MDAVHCAIDPAQWQNMESRKARSVFTKGSATHDSDKNRRTDEKNGN
jgi:hypothetical protein